MQSSKAEKIKEELSRCRYCGKGLKLNILGEPPLSKFCNDEHKKKMQKLWKQRVKKRVCINCGLDDIPKNQKHEEKKMCKACISKLLNHVEYIGKLLENIKDG